MEIYRGISSTNVQGLLYQNEKLAVKVTGWESFRDFFIEIINSVFDKNIGTKEQYLKEIYNSLYPNDAKINPLISPSEYINKIRPEKVFSALDTLFYVMKHEDANKFSFIINKDNNNEPLSMTIRFDHHSLPKIEFDNHVLNKKELDELVEICLDGDQSKGTYKLKKSCLDTKTTNIKFLEDIKYTYSKKARDLSNMDLRGLDLTGYDFDYKNLAGANLSGANLSRASFEHTNLSDTNLSNTDMRESTLRNVEMNKGTNLDGVSFFGAILNGVGFTNAKMNNVNLGYTVMSMVAFDRAEMNNVSMIGCFIDNSTMTNVVNKDLDMHGAHLYKVNMKDTKLNNKEFFIYQDNSPYYKRLESFQKSGELNQIDKLSSVS